MRRPSRARAPGFRPRCALSTSAVRPPWSPPGNTAGSRTTTAWTGPSRRCTWASSTPARCCTSRAMRTTCAAWAGTSTGALARACSMPTTRPWRRRGWRCMHARPCQPCCSRCVSATTCRCARPTTRSGRCGGGATRCSWRRPPGPDWPRRRTNAPTWTTWTANGGSPARCCTTQRNTCTAATPPTCTGGKPTAASCSGAAATAG